MSKLFLDVLGNVYSFSTVFKVVYLDDSYDRHSIVIP